MHESSASTNALAVALVLTIGSVLDPPAASAQNGYIPFGHVRTRASDTLEEIYVYSPRRGPERVTGGAPVEGLTISQPIRYDDLDLDTDFGARELKRRILDTANRLCRRTNLPASAGTNLPIADNLSCRQAVIEDAMEEADAAIARERGYGE